MNRISLADPKPGAYSVGINTTTGLSYNTRFDQTINLSIVPYAPHELLAFVKHHERWRYHNGIFLVNKSIHLHQDNIRGL